MLYHRTPFTVPHRLGRGRINVKALWGVGDKVHHPNSSTRHSWETVTLVTTPALARGTHFSLSCAPHPGSAKLLGPISSPSPVSCLCPGWLWPHVGCGPMLAVAL